LATSADASYAGSSDGNSVPSASHSRKVTDDGSTAVTA
jgi:hypothetical protein